MTEKSCNLLEKRVNLPQEKGIETSLVQINIYQSNSYKNDLSWLCFEDEPRVQKRQQIEDE